MTDGQTDRRTDGQTTDKVIPKWRFASLAQQKGVSNDRTIHSAAVDTSFDTRFDFNKFL